MSGHDPNSNARGGSGTAWSRTGFRLLLAISVCLPVVAAAASAQFMDLPRPVAIMGDDFVGPPAPEPGMFAKLWPSIWITVIAVGLVTSVAAVVRFWWGRLLPAQQAMLGMSLQLRLGRGDRAVLRHLAGFSGAGGEGSDLGLLLSEEAFATALTRCERESGGVDPIAVARVRRRIFG